MNQSLYEIYEKESHFYKRIMQIKALLFCTRKNEKTEFYHCIARSGLRLLNKVVSQAVLSPILLHLKYQGLLDDAFNCEHELIHRISADAVSPDNPDAASNLEIVQSYDSAAGYQNYLGSDEPSNMRAVHLAIYTNRDGDLLSQATSTHHPTWLAHWLMCIRNVTFDYDLDPEWVKTRHPIIQVLLLHAKLQGYIAVMHPNFPPDLDTWVVLLRSADWIAVAIECGLDHLLILMGRFLQINLYLKGPEYIKTKIAECSRAFDSEKAYFLPEMMGAIALFEEAPLLSMKHYALAKKNFKNAMVTAPHEWVRANLHAVLYCMALLYGNSTPAQLKSAGVVVNSFREVDQFYLGNLLDGFVQLKLSDRRAASECLRNIPVSQHPKQPFLHALFDWLGILLDDTLLIRMKEIFVERFLELDTRGEFLPAQLYAELIVMAEPTHLAARSFLDEKAPFGAFRFGKILQPKSIWEYTVDRLHAVLLKSNPAEKGEARKEGSRRLAWFVNPERVTIEVAEQVLSKTGRWTGGKAIALKRFHVGDPKLDYLTSQDRMAIKGLRRQTGGWYGGDEFYWNAATVLNALIGHPLVFHSQNHAVPIELIKGQLSLLVEAVAQGYRLSLNHFAEQESVLLIKETPNRYQVVHFGEEAVALANIVTKQGVTLPPQAKDRVVEMICHANTSIHIESALEDDNLPVVPGDVTPCIHLLPMEEGLSVNIWVRPFGSQGAYFRAAQGPGSMIIKKDPLDLKSKEKVQRDFKEEEQALRQFSTECTVLLERGGRMNEELHFESLEESLELLLALEEYKQSYPLIIEWPKGETLKVKKSISSRNLSLSVKGSSYWFEYEGVVEIDEGKTLSIKNLLELLEGSRDRFIPLGSGEFLALTDKFKKQLEDLKSMSDGNKLYHLSTEGFRELAEEAGAFEQDKAWAAHLQKVKAMTAYRPVLPSTLQAELRDYQHEGFAYLSRLAEWEIGACLADDMGLGKTVQAIAVLLNHAPRGPCLVVAPTSVCFGWLDELARFAPTLRPHILHHASNREALIGSLEKMDILICSYGLLHQSGEVLLQKQWQMVILDEAQAIKNSNTQRWKYATQLNSVARMALTGTPIENHLGELWSIFKFLNPGLLGSLKHFQERFAGPIEKDRDVTAKRALKNIVSPYILRRTKTEVLPELPAKIEQSIVIEPSPEETAFYEAVRIQALERIQNMEATDGGSKRFGILAEISRLRQACCASNLVDENMDIESSKLKTFLALVKNMIDNKHKVLVFSQFVRYLTQVRALLNEEGIVYQYLDGATPINDRRKSVDAFQAGEGDLFLISLKAGGTGLNLTAADYVIILDPWWNPAVEDQAADRAHRMGQQRPVTVYRLIMKNSIEEKIVALHKDKKDLAADLLSGGEMSGKLSEEALLGLIQGGGF